MKTASQPELLGVADLRERYQMGRDLAAELLRLMPHIKLGKKGRGDRLVVRRADFDALIQRATEEQRDLWELTRDFTPDTLREWLAGDSRGLN